MPKKAAKRPRPKHENILYVVLHGLICVVDVGKEGYIAHVLDMGDEHKYLLGDWLQEIDLPGRPRGFPPRRSNLLGVDCAPQSQQNVLDCTNNAVIQLTDQPSDESADVREVIRLPRPRCVHPFIRGTVQQGGISDPGGALKEAPSYLSGILVFEYTFPRPRFLRLEEDPDEAGNRSILWRASAPARVSLKDRTLNVVVLHVYDEPPGKAPQDVAEGHSAREFHLSCNFLYGQGLDLVLPTTTRLRDKLDRVPGLLRGEIVNLNDRSRFVAEMLLDVREGVIVPHDIGGGSGGPVCGGAHGEVVTTQAAVTKLAEKRIRLHFERRAAARTTPALRKKRKTTKQPEGKAQVEGKSK